MTLYKIHTILLRIAGFPSGSLVKSQPAIARAMGSIPGLAISPGEGNGNPLQCSCLGDPMDRRAWWARVHEVARVRHDLVTEHEPTDCCKIIKALRVTSGLWSTFHTNEGMPEGKPSSAQMCAFSHLLFWAQMREVWLWELFIITPYFYREHFLSFLTKAEHEIKYPSWIFIIIDS